MKRYQVVEKFDNGTDWQLVRYQDYAMSSFDTEESALEAAKKYLNSVNVDNSLAKSEKQAAAEAFMVLDGGVYLGFLDGEDWFLKDRHGNIVKNRNCTDLDGKAEVVVRPIPGT